MSKLFRRISIILGIVILAGVGYLAKQMTESKAPPPRKENPAPPLREVEVFKVQKGDVVSEMEVQGTLVAYNKVDIFAEVTGTLEKTAKPFKVGTYFGKGDILLDIDQQEANLNILSQKSTLLNAITQMMPDLKIDYPESFVQWKSYLDQFDVEHPLKAFPSPLNDQEKYFIASKNLLSQFYAIKSAENRLDKYTVYAPFSGVISQANINPGSLVRAGQKMGELMSTGSYELQATVNLEDLTFLKIGTSVNLYSDAMKGNWKGTVRRISDQIDPNTQAVIVFIGINGRGLREGMYLKGMLDTKVVKDAIKLPIELIIDQNQVFVVEDETLLLKEVEVLNSSATHAIINGLKNGEVLLKNKIIGGYEGMQVKSNLSSIASN